MTPEHDLKRLLLHEDPILFLGAGFSLGALTQSNEDFPTGSKLKENLITQLLKFEVGSSEYNDLINYKLSEVCDFCESEKSPAHLNDFLLTTFQNGTPTDYHEKISIYPWKKIYSTNIDDIVERCYTKAKKSLLVQNFHRKSTIDPKGKIELIKLHGCVNNPSEGLTFSINSYLDTLLISHDYRFNSLALDMHSESIIFVGSDFSEFNIDFYLKLYDNSGFQSSKGKLIFINPYLALFSKVR